MRRKRVTTSIGVLLIAWGAEGSRIDECAAQSSLPPCRPVRVSTASAEVPAPQPTAPEETAQAAPLAKMQALASAEGTTTLAELQQLAVANSPGLRQAGHQVEQAKGEWLQAGLYPNPTLSYVGNEIGDDHTAGQQGFQISQRIVTGGKLDWNRSVAHQDVERARWQANVQRRRVANSVAVQFYRTLAAQQNVRVVEELVKVVQQGLRATQNRYKADDVPETDVLLVEIELQAVELLKLNAEEELTGARRELAALAGMESLPLGELSGRLDAVGPRVGFESTWEELRANNPVIQAAHATVERARHRIQRERVKPIPDVLLQTGTVYDYVNHQTLHNVQVGLPLPLFDRNQGRISAAHSEYHRALANVSRLELALRQQLAGAFRDYEVAHSRADRYQNSILPKAERALEILLKTYDRGDIDLPQLLTAQRSVVENRVKWIQALGELRATAALIEGQLITGAHTKPRNVLP